ncbi:wax ester/triacylglycerol synthase domain-containing protein [Williamsia sp. CHRR-6]|uniref:wax ester/triacylglycerol synthase domain-containing protein n=1 Tax=Williamsia sp. CHRR-6 TaxID=2835871 RepID=UPI001BDAA5C4|nr:wax ester/triacylglycerol synthase domain-containing protein [Williamsia sp. CHRR-6]MBT0565545.1 DUF1298 domain-containing protein [Williamsia sp. CHRR-6]
MSSTDVTTHWMSAVIPNDQFLLYSFVGVDLSPAEVASTLAQRAAGLAELRLRVLEVPGSLDYPYWVRAQPEAEQVRVHTADDWSHCLSLLAQAMGDQLDTRRQVWRLHVFTPVGDVPGSRGQQSTVVVVQMAHALADGTGASAIARELFSTTTCSGTTASGTAGSGTTGLGTGRSVSTPVLERLPGLAVVAALTGVLRTPVALGSVLARAPRAHRAHRRREADIAAGRMSAADSGATPCVVNVHPGDRRRLAVVPVAAARLRRIGGSVTVGALVIVGEALSSYLEVDSGLRAEVAMALPPRSQGNVGNSFRMVGVDLAVDEPDRDRRAARIRADLDAARRRGTHPAVVAEAAVLRALPAVLVRHGVRSFDASVRPETVTGNTVVSSVDRGAADLRLGEGRVQLTAGFPALSPMQSLTHGVHGIGNTVALSVCASPDVVDVAHYRALLAAAAERR